LEFDEVEDGILNHVYETTANFRKNLK